MSILFYLIPVSLICSSLGLIAYIWAVQTGQFDNLKKNENQLLDYDRS